MKVSTKHTAPTNSGLSLGTVLFLIFLVLKLTNHINWSWWYVTMPLWIIPAVLFAVAGVIYTVYLPFWLVGQRRRANFRGKRTAL